MLLRTFRFHFGFVGFDGQKLVRFSVRKMRIEHTTNASIWKTDISKMLEVQYGFVQLNEKKIFYIYCRGNAMITFEIYFGLVNC